MKEIRTKECILYYSTMQRTKLGRAHLQREKSDRRWRWGRLTTKRHEETFGGHADVIHLDWGDTYMNVYICQTHQTKHGSILLCVNYVSTKLIS